ncbi:type VI secretion system lipoprotein TssJ [Lysobacter sp. A03]|uniref:type VI secretion system lipoprotein TssJ n=1 Tax=Lysobacter sp. A03 TaxID=1199154 RepID=UPI0005B6D028|nr:type VI secretion system lipoprotein TssJ [Lysobacter sp. A03]KIQ98075.1 putative transmembrane protein [Lysobacter sp. A03]
MDAVYRYSDTDSRESPSSRTRPSRPPVSAVRRVACLLVTAACLAASGCASQGGGVKQAIGKTLQAVGLKQGEAQRVELPIRLYAGDNLNTGDDGRAAALVVRVYQLRNAKRFDDAAFDVFLDERREHDVLGDDLVSVTEFLLTPGKRHEVLEALADDASHIGVVALFRAPAPTRWRFTFDTGQTNAEGVTVGLHGCAMTTASPGLVTRLSTPAHSLSSSRCGPVGR